MSIKSTSPYRPHLNPLQHLPLQHLPLQHLPLHHLPLLQQTPAQAFSTRHNHGTFYIIHAASATATATAL